MSAERDRIAALLVEWRQPRSRYQATTPYRMAEMILNLLERGHKETHKDPPS